MTIDYSKGYRNVYYDARNKEMRVWGWNKEGDRVETVEPYSPYLYVETSTNNYDATSIFGTRLKRVNFPRSQDRRKFVEKHPTGRVFHNLTPENQFLVDTFQHYDTEQMTQMPFRMAMFDIEVHSPDEFPRADEAKHPVNIITVFDTLTRKYYTWGTKPFDTDRLNKVLTEQGIDPISPSDVVYRFCRSEIELFEWFIEWWRGNFPDIMTGWNSDQFDVPYIINRLIRLFGEDSAREISPVRQIFKREGVARNIFGQQLDKWHIKGINVLDYMELYRTFSRGDSESYKLGDVGSKELGIGKIQHDSSDLVTLADTDWDLFVAYNIQDVNLLVEMEKKLQFLQLARFVTTKGFAKADAALGKISIVSGAMAAQANLKGLQMATFRNDAVTRDEYDGGYVREPVRGMHSDIVSYDANSLYPNTIITLNISPETKIGKIVAEPSEHNPHYIIIGADGTRRKFTTEKFDDLLKRGKIARSSQNVLYTQLRRGIVPAFIDGLYQERVDTKTKIAEINQQLKQDPNNEQLKIKANQLDIVQYTIKILLNSIYGNFANVASPLFDVDSAGSITLSGQATIKQAGEIANRWVKKTFDEDVDVVVYGDTDSVYLSFEQLKQFELLGPDRLLLPTGRQYILSLDSYMNEQITAWATEQFGTTDSRLVFKREVISDAGIFMEKKRYVLRVAYDEDDAVDKMKYTGVEIARSSHSEPVKDIIRNVVRVMFETKDQQRTTAAYQDAYGKFLDLPEDDIAKRISLNNLEENERLYDTIHKPKGVKTAYHVAAAIAYNRLLEIYGVELKYPPLSSGAKIKLVYLQPNIYDIKLTAFDTRLPAEFEVEIDNQKMFDVLVRPIIEKLYQTIGWHLPKNIQRIESTLFDLFG